MQEDGRIVRCRAALALLLALLMLWPSGVQIFAQSPQITETTDEHQGAKTYQDKGIRKKLPRCF